MVLVANGFDTIVYSRGPVSSPQASFVQAIGVTYSCSETDSAERLAQRVGNIDLVYEAARDLLVDEPNGIKQVVTFDQGKE